MKTFFLAAAVAVTVVGSAARASDFPTFERKGFPITRHQIAVMGAQDVQEQSASPTLTFGGMPASPHQIAVLTPRPEIAITTAKPSTVGLAAQ